MPSVFLLVLIDLKGLEICLYISYNYKHTVKTLRSQRREYGFESHTGHQIKRRCCCISFFAVVEVD